MVVFTIKKKIVPFLDFKSYLKNSRFLLEMTVKKTFESHQKPLKNHTSVPKLNKMMNYPRLEFYGSFLVAQPVVNF